MDAKTAANECIDVSSIKKIKHGKLIQTKITMFYFPDKQNDGGNAVGGCYHSPPSDPVNNDSE